MTNLHPLTIGLDILTLVATFGAALLVLCAWAWVAETRRKA